MGTTGIAVASLIAGVITLLCILYYFFKKAKVYRFSSFTFSWDVMKHTFLNGSSEFIGELSLCIAMFAYNLVIMRHIGTTGITAFAIAGYISYIFSMIIVGFGQGIVPLTGFSYGAKDYSLARKLRNITNKIVFLAGTLLFLIVLLISKWYGNLFVESEAVSQMIDSGVKIFALSFLCSGVNTITSFYYTSLGKAMESAVISSARGLIILLICIFTLPSLLGMTGVWLAAPVTEGLTLVISLLFMHRERKTAP
jgi:Na+-driven multidrug efflux pump